MLKSFSSDETGSNQIEYSLIFGFIAVAIVLAAPTVVSIFGQLMDNIAVHANVIAHKIGG